MRPSMTLDLAGSRLADPASDAVLSSPDVRLLKLATPELERLVLQQYRQPHHHHQPHQQNSSKDRQLTLDVAVTDEDARGFVDVQLEVHGQRQPDCDSAVIRSTTQTSVSVTTGPPHGPVLFVLSSSSRKGTNSILSNIAPQKYRTVRWPLSSSVVVCNTPRQPICNVTYQGAARDGGPVVLRPVMATHCLTSL